MQVSVDPSRQTKHRRLGVLCAFALCACLASSASVAAGVNRCGWFQNPTPANAWLVDRDGTWVVSVQGGHSAEGDWPNFKASQWVRTNGNYGHGCACMLLVANGKDRQVGQIVSSKPMPLSVCRADRSIKEPK